jgi:hypothetical protein
MASDGEEQIIKELCSSILRLPIFGFVRSRSFRHFCSEIGLEDIWNSCVAKAQYENRRVKDFEAYDDRHLGRIICHFILTIYDRRSADFIEITGNFLHEAYKHDRVRFPLMEFDPEIVQRIEAGLVELGNENSRIKKVFSRFQSKNDE